MSSFGRSPASIDEHCIAAQFADDLRIAVVREREYVDPRVNAYLQQVGPPDEFAQRIDVQRFAHPLVGRGPGVGRIEPRLAAAVDLHEEVRGADRTRVLDQVVDALGVFENPLAPLAQDPKSARSAAFEAQIGFCRFIGRCGRGGFLAARHQGEQASDQKSG